MSPKEQKRIVHKIEGVLALLDPIKSHIRESQITQLNLADAMAEQALN